jgi:Response regulator containing CheY-like receiver domain and AraC-type DNA-binding domain
MLSYIVVDDEYLIRQGIIKKIDSEKLSLQMVGEADDGDEALILIKEKNPDIILMDMKMPGLDGMSLLKTVHASYPEKKVIVISGYSDFEYTRCAIENNVAGYLLKPFDRNQINQLLEKVITAILSERNSRQQMDSIMQENQKFHKSSDMQNLANIIINPAEWQKNLKTKSVELDSIIKTRYFIVAVIFSEDIIEESVLEGIIDQCGATKFCNFIFWQSNPRQFILIFFYDTFSEQNAQDIYMITENIFEKLYRIYEGHLYLAVGKTKEGVDHLRSAYLECLTLFDTRELKSKRGVLTFLNRKHGSAPFTWSDEDFLIFFMESGNRDKVSEYIHALFQFIENTPGITIRSVRDIYSSLVKNIIHIIEVHSISLETQIFSDIAQSLVGFVDLQLMENALLENCLHITDYLIKEKMYSSESLTENIKKYVQSNYNKLLNLDKIASLFFVNPSYCSYIFKVKTGENLSNYIARIRVEKAKDILTSTDFNVSKVSRAVGYDNVNYFFKVFKNYAGCTPLEYKNTVNK